MRSCVRAYVSRPVAGRPSGEHRPCLSQWTPVDAAKFQPADPGKPKDIISFRRTASAEEFRHPAQVLGGIDVGPGALERIGHLDDQTVLERAQLLELLTGLER